MEAPGQKKCLWCLSPTPPPPQLRSSTTGTLFAQMEVSSVCRWGTWEWSDSLCFQVPYLQGGKAFSLHQIFITRKVGGGGKVLGGKEQETGTATLFARRIKVSGVHDLVRVQGPILCKRGWLPELMRYHSM